MRMNLCVHPTSHSIECRGLIYKELTRTSPQTTTSILKLFQQNATYNYQAFSLRLLFRSVVFSCHWRAIYYHVQFDQISHTPLFAVFQPTPIQTPTQFNWIVSKRRILYYIIITPMFMDHVYCNYHRLTTIKDAVYTKMSTLSFLFNVNLPA